MDGEKNITIYCQRQFFIFLGKSLLDSATQNLLISNKWGNFLNLPLTSSTQQLVGINRLSEETCLKSATLEFAPYFSEQFQPLTAIIVNSVTTPLRYF